VDSFSDIAKKAFYFGVGLAAYTAERAGVKLQELQGQAQQLTDELVQRGEATAKETQQWIGTVMPQVVPPEPPPAANRPRSIEILDAEIESDSSEQQ
jgi:polyhydroxyalkanoate synthesis regulator phasin